MADQRTGESNSSVAALLPATLIWQVSLDAGKSWCECTEANAAIAVDKGFMARSLQVVEVVRPPGMAEDCRYPVCQHEGGCERGLCAAGMRALSGRVDARGADAVCSDKNSGNPKSGDTQ